MCRVFFFSLFLLSSFFGLGIRAVYSESRRGGGIGMRTLCSFVQVYSMQDERTEA